MFRRSFPPSVAFVLIIACVFAFAPARTADAFERKAYHVERTDLPIEIDGRLDDEAWKLARPDDTFHQVNPDEGEPPTEATVFRVLTDGQNLYVAIRMTDSEPHKMIANQMVQDGNQFGDSRINLYFDTFNDQRNGYFFQINPNGTRREGLVENNSNFRMEWNTIWYAASTVDADGWSAEFKIPFKSIVYAADGDGVWGFEVERIVRRKNEMTRWGNYSRNRAPGTMANSGTLTGLSNLEGTGLDVKPSGSILQRHTWERDDDARLLDEDDDTKFEPSGDVFYKFHPSITATVTANTDFLEAPPDDQRNIVTRFPPFLPERRAFFLQDAAIFEVAELTEAITPFRSRTLGRNSDDEILDIDVGAKLTGRLGDFNFGGQYVRVPAQKGQGATDLAVMRLQQNVLQGSAVGLIGTIGDRDDGDDNALIGGDFQFFDNELVPGRIVKTTAYFLQTITDGETRHGQAFGIDFIYPNDRVDASLRYRDIGQAFNPSLGGVLRPGIREWFTDYRYRWRPGNYFRTIDSEMKLNIVTNRDVDLETLKYTWDFLTFENNFGDQLIFGYEHREERLRRDPFPVSSDVTIPLGSYDFDRFRAKLAASVARKIQPSIEFVGGTYYSGTLYQTNVKIELRPSKHLYLAFEYEHNKGDVDEGEFTQRLGRVRSTVAFTPVISLTNVIQYDNGTQKMGHSSIFRWEIESGNDLYLIFNYDWIEDDGPDRMVSTKAEGAVKVSWTFRF